MALSAQTTTNATLAIYPWVDPIFDSSGFPARSDYVEEFWLGILGPTATWLLRRLASGFDHYPEGFELDLVETAQALGTTYRPGHESPFTRAIERLSIFGLAQKYADGLAVRTHVPLVPDRYLPRLPRHLRDAHAGYEI
ncbi:MAG: hypothetical protein FJW44_04530 [Actinobacteria bacterium]|nr:hypothetical protein [Actinomycetota bacterium]